MAASVKLLMPKLASVESMRQIDPGPGVAVSLF